MDYEHLIIEIASPLATITFNRPKALNALNAALIDELANALDEIATNEDVRVLILTGAGDKSFVAGADINELATFNPLEAKLFSQKGHQTLHKLQTLPIPVIAAVNGFALGGGSEIALACDFVYASQNAKFGLPEITLGIIPGFGGTQRLPRLIGKNLAKELIFTGKMISADDAQQLGIVNQVHAPEALMDVVHKTATSIAAKGRAALRAAKNAINSGMDVDLQTGCGMEIDAFSVCMSSTDAKEGTKAFLEKRKAIFTGTLTT